MFQPYQDLLTAFAEEIGLEPEALLVTEEVVIDGLPVGLQLEGQDDDAEVLLCSLLAVPHPERWTETARLLLQANHLWSGTCGATLGMLPDDDMISLSMRRPLRDLTADSLAVLVAKAADIGIAWQELIVERESADAAPAFFDAVAPLRA
jgi:hypothetical protein